MENNFEEQVEQNISKKKYNSNDIIIALLKSFLYILAWLAISYISVFVATFVAVFVSEATGEYYMDILNRWSVAITLISDYITIAAIFLFYIARTKSSGNPFEKINIRPVSKKIIGGAVMLGVGVQMVTILLASYLPIPKSWFKTQNEVYSDVNQNLFSIITIITVAVIAPVVEELIFRGLVLGRLSGKMPRWVAIAISACAFGLVHTGMFAKLYAFALGMVLGWVFTKFNSVLPTIIIHAAYNFSSLCLGMIPESVAALRIIVIIAGLVMFAFSLVVIINNPASEHTDNINLKNSETNFN